MNIKLDVLVVQLLHIAILFRVFKKIIGNSLIDAIAERKAQIIKLRMAESEYERLMEQATLERDALLEEANESKKHLLDEAKQLAEVRKSELISAAQLEASLIKSKADQAQKALSDELYSNFESMVKTTASAALKKMIPNNTEAHQSYLQQITVK